MPMDIRVGDVLTMKKKHPCGCAEWEVLRVGMDFRLRCRGCAREVMIPRTKAERGLKSLLRTGENLEEIKKTNEKPEKQ